MQIAIDRINETLDRVAASLDSQLRVEYQRRGEFRVVRALLTILSTLVTGYILWRFTSGSGD